MKKIFFTIAAALVFASLAHSQIPTATLVKIVKAEDARAFDKTLEDLMKAPNSAIQIRAALAAGRIGDDRALPVLTALLEKEQSEQVRTMAAFALGEIESVKGADAILKALADPQTPHEMRARAVEAAGKIAAANAKDPKAKELAAAILNVLDFELTKRPAPYIDVVRLGLTAALRARPAGADEIVRKYLAFSDPNVVADALNTLARLRAKNANRDARGLLATSVHALVRANAARVLAAAEDKDALDILVGAATTDADSRVRVSAIRALGAIRDAKAADKLLDRAAKLLSDHKGSTYKTPIEKSELLDIATTLGRILANKRDDRAITFLKNLAAADGYSSDETEIAFARIAPKIFSEYIVAKPTEVKRMSRALETATRGMRELATLDDATENADIKKVTIEQLRAGLFHFSENDQFIKARSVPDLMRAFAAFKPNGLDLELRNYLTSPDVFIRATAAELLADQPKSKQNVEALTSAFTKALLTDKHDNDAQLAILDALYKLDKNESVGTLLVAFSAPDYLVRKKAFELLADKDLQRDFPGIPTSLENAHAKHKDQVLPYSPAFGTKLGQVLNTDAVYRRALSRKNGTVKAVLNTEKGTFTIDFYPEEAPLTVDNFVKLARSGYFNGVEVHRVVPNFVMQDGDPRGDGNGGPGWSIRCEVNMLTYDRGAVGMALSGKDTGGSQWFVTHSPQPHLDGGYTVFGHVNEADMKVVDNIVRGDKIISVKIIEGNSPQRAQKTQRK